MKRFSVAGVLAIVSLSGIALGTVGPSAKAETYSTKLSCANPRMLCTEVADPQAVFGSYYVGHDEPSVEFFSNVAGSGNNMQYTLTIPKQPTGAFSQTKGYDFQLHPAFWFGMAMCDTFSYPETNKTCTPDSDTNIVDPTKQKHGPGVAFEELQFYPPGWVPQFAGQSCNATQWCAALAIFSLSENPFTGQVLNPTCQSLVAGGVEYTNFAFLTLNGVPLGPPNPLDFNAATSGFPQNANTLFLNGGDKTTVNLHDTPNGLQATVTDLTTATSGFMVASAANHFGHIVYAPTGSSCVEKDYTFHPMYSTSSPKTRVLWAAHTYNVAFSDEIGHFDFCTHINANSPAAACDGKEGIPTDQEAADGDDVGCFASETSLLYPTTGCVGTNAPGFDGVPYQSAYWPNSTSLAAPSTVPKPFDFTEPLTGATYTTAYSQFAFEADLPRIEASDLGGPCVRFGPGIGTGCTNPPKTDDGANAFYPYYTQLTDCSFVEGGNFATGNNFGGSSQTEYGPLNPQVYWLPGGHGATQVRVNTFNSGPHTITATC